MAAGRSGTQAGRVGRCGSARPAPGPPRWPGSAGWRRAGPAGGPSRTRRRHLALRCNGEPIQADPGGGRRTPGGRRGRDDADPGRGGGRGPRRHRLPVVGRRPAAAPPPAGGRAGLPGRPVLYPAPPPAAGAVAPGLPGLRRPGRGAAGVRLLRLLALLPLAVVPVGELAAPAPARLPGLRGAAVLVLLPQDGRLPPVPNANNRTLGAPTTGNGSIGTRPGVNAPPGQRTRQVV
jgi:hypothetical protein